MSSSLPRYCLNSLTQTLERLTCALFLLFLAFPNPSFSQTKESPDSPSTLRIIVKFATGAQLSAIQSVEQKFNLSLIKELPTTGLRIYQTPHRKNPDDLIKQINQDPSVQYAEIDQVIHLSPP